MDDGDGPRTPDRERPGAGDARGVRSALVAFLAAGIVAVAALAAALASPPASAGAAGADPADVAATAPPLPDDTAPASRSLAWWVAGEVGVLVVGGAVWCRRANRRQSARTGATRALTGAARGRRPGRAQTAEPPPPRYRL